MNVERLLPADAVRPLWSSSSALVYAGGLVALFATVALLGIAGDDGGTWALVGAAVVAGSISLGLAETLARMQRAIAAGVAATLAVVFAGVVVGGLLDATGLLEADIGDYQPAALLVEAVLIGASLAAVARYRAPLPVLVAALTFWIAVADLGSLTSWDDAGELLSVAAGVLLAAAGVVVDRAGREPFGFWLHAVGGLAAGGGLVALADESSALIALFALGYLALAFVLRRSSYAVLGVIGVLVATTLFAVDPLALVGGFLPFGSPGEGDALEGWQVALSYLVAGLALAAIGVAGRLRWPRRSAPVATGD